MHEEESCGDWEKGNPVRFLSRRMNHIRLEKVMIHLLGREKSSNHSKHLYSLLLQLREIKDNSAHGNVLCVHICAGEIILKRPAARLDAISFSHLIATRGRLSDATKSIC